MAGEGAAHLAGLGFAFMGVWVALTLTSKTLPMMERSKPTLWRHWLRRKFTELCGCATNFGLATSGAIGNDHELTQMAGALRDADTAASKRRASTLAIVRILINYMSMTSLLTSFKLDWGASLRWLFGIQKVMSGAMPPLMDCMGIGFVAQSTLALLLPVFIATVPLLPIGLWLLPQLHVQGRLLGGPWLPPGVTLCAPELLWPAVGASDSAPMDPAGGRPCYVHVVWGGVERHGQEVGSQAVGC